MKINGEEIINIEINGTDEFVKAFTDRIANIFDYSWSDKIGKMFLDEVEIKMQRIFRTKDGKYINPKSKLGVTEGSSPLTNHKH